MRIPVVHPPPGVLWALQRDPDKLVKPTAVSTAHLFRFVGRAAIGYLGTLDRVFGVPVTTRNWNTISAIGAALGVGAS